MIARDPGRAFDELDDENEKAKEQDEKNMKVLTELQRQQKLLLAEIFDLNRFKAAP